MNFCKVEKRAGARRPIKGKPKLLPENDYFKDKKGLGLYPKKLGQYRFLIYTNFDLQDEITLTMLTAWIKMNENYFDNRNSFPIYGFIVDNEQAAEAAGDFLQRFGDLLAWNDDQHHLYNGLQSAKNRIWLDNESLRLNEFCSVKPSNLFTLYLKSPMATNTNNIAFLKQIPGAILYDSVRFDHSKEIPLLKIDPRTILSNTVLTAKEFPKLFNDLDEAEEPEFAEILNKKMYEWNDSQMDSCCKILQELPEFSDTDFDDLESFTADRSKLDADAMAKYKLELDLIQNLLVSNGRQFECEKQLLIIAILIASSTLIKSPFELKKDGAPGSNYTLIIKEGNKQETVRKFISEIIFTALKITR